MECNFSQKMYDTFFHMKKQDFKQKIQEVLDEIGPEAFVYNTDEYWMIKRQYEFIEQYAVTKRLYNTSIALPLVRGLHNGIHRKSSLIRDGVSYKLPYVIHCLMVCKMLIYLQVPVDRVQEDILLAAALCHDMIEDVPFENNGLEMTDVYHLDPRVYETVKIVSKRDDFSEAEHLAYFDHIQGNILSLLVKLSDRGNNIEDLYNMSLWKTHEYVDETRRYFFPMVEYGKEHFPDLYHTLDVLENKLTSLTQVAEILVSRYEERDSELRTQLKALEEENDRLREEMTELFDQTDSTPF